MLVGIPCPPQPTLEPRTRPTAHSSCGHHTTTPHLPPVHSRQNDDRAEDRRALPPHVALPLPHHLRRNTYRTHTPPPTPPRRSLPALSSQERKYILDMCKKIQKSGCNVLLIQKSILRDAVNELSLHFLAKMKILVVTDIERDDIEFISKTCGCLPVANADTFHAEKLGKADLVEEKQTGEGKVVMVTGAGGSIGSELCRQILASSPRELILLDISEFALYSVDRDIKSLCQRQGLFAAQ